MARRKSTKAIWSTRRRFQAFIERATELLETRLLKGGVDLSYKMRFESKTQQFTVTTPQLDPDDWRSLLILLRQFVSDSEPIYISKIMKDANRWATDEEIKLHIADARKLWNQVYRTSGLFPIILNDQELTTEKALDIIMYSKHIHTDPDKADFMENFGTYPIPTVEMQLHLNLPNLLNVIFFVRAILLEGLKNESFNFSDASEK
jgi:hypothetical protein